MKGESNEAGNRVSSGVFRDLGWVYGLQVPCCYGD